MSFINVSVTFSNIILCFYKLFRQIGLIDCGAKVEDSERFIPVIFTHWNRMILYVSVCLEERKNVYT